MTLAIFEPAILIFLYAIVANLCCCEAWFLLRPRLVRGFLVISAILLSLVHIGSIPPLLFFSFTPEKAAEGQGSPQCPLHFSLLPPSQLPFVSLFSLHPSPLPFTFFFQPLTATIVGSFFPPFLPSSTRLHSLTSLYSRGRPGGKSIGIWHLRSIFEFCICGAVYRAHL